MSHVHDRCSTPQRCLAALAAVSLLLAAGAAAAQSVVSRSEPLKGFADVYRRAQRFLGPETSSLAQMEVHVAVHEGALVLHSNYVTRGHPRPTKLAVRGGGPDMLAHVF